MYMQQQIRAGIFACDGFAAAWQQIFGAVEVEDLG